MDGPCWVLLGELCVGKKEEFHAKLAKDAKERKAFSPQFGHSSKLLTVVFPTRPSYTHPSCVRFISIALPVQAAT
jgi:hypothetical protein